MDILFWPYSWLPIATVVLLMTTVLAMNGMAKAKKKNIEYKETINEQKEILNINDKTIEELNALLERERETFLVNIKEYQTITEAANERTAGLMRVLTDMQKLMQDERDKLQDKLEKLMEDERGLCKKSKWRSIDEPFEPQA